LLGELLVKECLRIQMTLAEELLDQGGELEIPGSWTEVIWKEQFPPTFDDIQVLGSISHSLMTLKHLVAAVNIFRF